MRGGGARRIVSFSYTASSIPANTSLRISFSRTGSGTAWYSSSGSLYGWDTLSQGTHTIYFNDSDWKSTAKFYYKVSFLSDGVDTPVLDAVQLTFDSLINQYDTYHSTGSLVSTNLLSGENAVSIDSFLATVSVLPGQTSLAVQFSQNGTTWFNAAGSQNESTALVAAGNTVDLSGLGWSGADFYYRINFSSSGSNTAVLDDIALSFTTDTTPPAAPGAPDLIASSDTGESSTDNITNDTTPTLTASCETAATVTIFSGSTALGSGTCASSTVSITSSALSGATYNLKAKQRDVAGNYSATGAALSVTIDTTAPTASTLSPADDAIDVAITSSLVLTFTEAITKAGTGTVTIRKSSDDSVFEVISVTGSLVTGSGTTQITINPAADLSNSTAYYVQISSTAFPDSAGNFYAGISDSTTWNFTTVAAAAPASSSSSSTQGTSSGGGGGGGHRGSPESTKKRIAAAYALMLSRFENVKRESDQLFVDQEEEQVDLAAAAREQRIADRIATHKATIARLNREQIELSAKFAERREERLQIALERNERERADEQAALLAQQEELKQEQEQNQKRREQRIAEQQQSSSPHNKKTLAAVAERRNRLFVSIDDTPVLYKDIVVDSWYAPYVSYMIEERIATGYADEQGKLKGEFGVANSITRAELLKMALEAANTKIEGGSPRNATAKGTWASSYVFTAESLKLSAFSSSIDVNAPATRGEVIQTLLEAMKFPIGTIPSMFSDVPNNHPYTAAIGLAAYYGFIQGDTAPDGTALNRFRPNDPINRAEVSKIIALMREVTK